MNQREKTLAMIVGVILAIFINVMLFRFFAGNRSQLVEERTLKSAQLEGLRQLYADKELWEKRGAELKEQQPAIENELRAGSDFLTAVQNIAKEHTVLIESPTLGTLSRQTHYISVPVTVSAKGDWEKMIDFLIELQGKNTFVAIESATINVDPSATTQAARGTFRVAKWFAPK